MPTILKAFCIATAICVAACSNGKVSGSGSNNSGGGDVAGDPGDQGTGDPTGDQSGDPGGPGDVGGDPAGDPGGGPGDAGDAAPGDDGWLPSDPGWTPGDAGADLSQTVPNTIAAMPPNAWLELSAANVGANVSFENLDPGLPIPLDGQFHSGFGQVIGGWGGGSYVPGFGGTDNRFCITGGGHYDYPGNEVYVLNLHTWRTTRIGPSDPADIVKSVSAYNDGTPSATHTYGNPTHDGHGHFVLPYLQSTWGGGGDNFADLWSLDLDTGVWTRHLDDTYANGAGGNTVAGGAGAYDAVNDRVLHTRNAYGALTSWAAGETIRTKHGDATDYYGNMEGGMIVVDSTKKLAVLIGSDAAWMVWDLDGAAINDASAQPTVTGPTGLFVGGAAGLAFRPTDGKVYAWNGGNAVATFTADLTSIAVIEVTDADTSAGTPPDAPYYNAAFTYGRWFYYPPLDVFIGVQSMNGNFFVYKP